MGTVQAICSECGNELTLPQEIAGEATIKDTEKGKVIIIK